MAKQQIQADSKEALKSGDQFKLGVLRMLLSSISVKEKEKRYKIAKDTPDSSEEALIKQSELSEEEIQNTITSEIKKRRDAIALYEQGGRPELAEKERKEIEVLQKYLPEQLSEEELTKIIKDSIEKTGAKEMKDMGKIMADLMPKVKGKAEGGQISKIIKDLLSLK